MYLVVGLVFTACANNSHQEKANNDYPADTASKTNATQSATPTTISLNNDTLVVDRQAAVFIEPDSIRIEKQKKQVAEEVFYTGADDYVFYMSIAHAFLDSVKLTTLNTKDKKFVKFVRADKAEQLIDIDKLPELWSIYFFDPAKKAKQINMTMIDDEYKNYFAQ